MLRWKGMAAPTIVAMVASPAPRRKPRRSEYDSRPKKVRSASSGSLAKNSWRSGDSVFDVSSVGMIFSPLVAPSGLR